jgi:hypothetical protein
MMRPHRESRQPAYYQRTGPSPDATRKIPQNPGSGAILPHLVRSIDTENRQPGCQNRYHALNQS